MVSSVSHDRSCHLTTSGSCGGQDGIISVNDVLKVVDDDYDDGDHQISHPFENDECLQVFSQKYEVQNVLGTGISGVVRKCTEKGTGKKYAVKIVDLIGQKENDRESLEESTLREISILRMLANHPHIIELHDAFVGKTHILLVLELCQRELFDILTEVVTFSETRTRVIMKQLLEAVEFIHSKKIAHRDIKAENILVDDNNNIKLSDFGFASTLEHDNEFTDLCGTFEYLSPELLKNQLYDNYQGYGRSVDMWACGTLMYTLLQGSSPFWAPERAQILKNILGAKYSFNNPRWNDYSYNAKDLIVRLLTVDPEVRLTAKEALRHPFFGADEYSPLPFIENDSCSSSHVNPYYLLSTTPPKSPLKLSLNVPVAKKLSTTSTTTKTLTPTASTTTKTLITTLAMTTTTTSPTKTSANITSTITSTTLSNEIDSSTVTSTNFTVSATTLTTTSTRNPLRTKLKAAMLAVQAAVFFLRLIPHAIIPVYQVSTDPYSVRSFRRLIDSGAFKIYGHWVNRDPTQSRDLLFENNRKMTARQRLLKSNLLNAPRKRSIKVPTRQT